MSEIKVLLNTIDKIKKFVSITTSYASEFDLKSGRYVIDGKSIMGIFALDTSKPYTLVIYEDDEKELKEIRLRLAEFAV